MKFCFLENTPFKYDSRHLYSDKLRGAESVLINLSNSLSKLGHKVTVINNCPESKEINGIKWKNINHYNDKENFDVAISNNDTNLFDKVNSSKKLLISHSLQSIEKFIRKSQLTSYIKHKPIVILLSNYHQKNRSKLITLFGHIRVDWAVDDIFINTKISDQIDKNMAIFTSKEDRNLDLLINIWTTKIYPSNKKYKLLITPPNYVLKNESILLRNKESQINLISDLLKARIYLIPGHKAELFCLAAEEARELCIPIVTLGIGSLSERVEHGKTGFIAKNNKEFADYSLNLFKDDNLWNSLRENLINIRGKKTWNKVCFDLINSINNF